MPDEGIMKKIMNKCDCRGFTMIELLVVIFIMGIMAAIAIPSLLSYMPKSRLSGATRTLAGDLMAARMDAVKMNRTVKVEHLGDKLYKIAYTGVSSDKTLKSVDITNEYNDVDIADFNLIEFNSRGATVASKTVTLTNPSGSKTIDVSIAGRVKIN